MLQNILPKVLEIIQIFFVKGAMSFGQQWFSPYNSPMDALLLPSLLLIFES